MRSRRGRANSPVRLLSYSRSRYSRSRTTRRERERERERDQCDALRHRNRTCGNCANVKCRPINPGHGAKTRHDRKALQLKRLREKIFSIFNRSPVQRKIARGAVCDRIENTTIRRASKPPASFKHSRPSTRGGIPAPLFA
ncbi:hypothetical protein ALC57_13483 [Trachymyrmex cornetzi]|uniref:Uncharacterized protein n=1 Tax=Trachymyrmex cornetzi TaxID=471704 RepID=A0A195DNB1_9HYME|nr:hypothetical protein ALC57_13483 [Trachymyrmex cornetzi]